MTRKVGVLRHKLYMDNFFSSAELLGDLKKKKINTCGTVRLNRKGMSEDLRYKAVELGWGKI
jgi:hypothetical protein